MNLELVNLGIFANDGTGDDLRTAFEKVNSNFTTLNSTSIENGLNLGSGSPIFAGVDNNALKFRSIKEGININVSYDGTSITIAAEDLLGSVSQDPSPQLGADLDLNNHKINGLGITESLNSVTLSAGLKTLTANITGTFTGTLVGSASTSVSISNHNIADLGDVASTAPVLGQALVWSGSNWAPAGAGLDFNLSVDWIFPGFDGIITNPIQYVLGTQDQDMGTFASPSAVEIFLGTF